MRFIKELSSQKEVKKKRKKETVCTAIRYYAKYNCYEQITIILVDARCSFD